MKIIGNWSLWIIIALLAFLSYIVSFLIFASSERIDIVEEKYYEKGLEYQKQIDIESRTGNLSEKVRIEKMDKTIKFYFPKDFLGHKLDGKITFYRPSDSRMDKTYKLNLDSNLRQLIDYSKFRNGIWIIKINWKTTEKTSENDYYYEEEMIF